MLGWWLNAPHVLNTWGGAILRWRRKQDLKLSGAFGGHSLRRTVLKISRVGLSEGGWHLGIFLCTLDEGGTGFCDSGDLPPHMGEKFSLVFFFSGVNTNRSTRA